MKPLPPRYEALQTQLSQMPDFEIKLCETLHEIGINDEMVQKRRQNELLHETIGTVMTKLRGYDRPEYHFGSRSEGTTTLGLQSDIDRLYIITIRKVVQSLNELTLKDKASQLNVLMVQGGNIAPGYCHLQVVSNEVDDPNIEVTDVNDHYVRLQNGLVYYKNTVMEDFIPGMGDRHGPSWATTSQTGFTDQDTVTAFHCKSWPYQARDWLNQSSLGGWPTNEMKRECMKTGCFVVPTGSSPDKDMEWRISTSLAERQLMFSLNITQLRCYILMKMLMKTYMKGEQKDKISSFMCKTVLMYCVESSPPDIWQEEKLLYCLMKCLNRLQQCIKDEDCPHFIIPHNNLMTGKFTPNVKKEILDMMHYITNNTRLILAMGINIDDIKRRFLEKLGMSTDGKSYLTPDEISWHIKGMCMFDTAVVLKANFDVHLKQVCMETKGKEKVEEFLQKSLQSLGEQISQGSEFHQEVYSFVAPLISTLLGSVLASHHGINSGSHEANEALQLLQRGSKSDVSSGRLKLASTLFCSGDMERTDAILQETDDKYDIDVTEPICRCTHFQFNLKNANFSKFQEKRNEVFRNIVAFCVVFLPCEMRCIPKELQYELFRLSVKDMTGTREVTWMDWAAIDSLPFLYFLQYKMSGKLNRKTAQQVALSNMVKVTETTPNLGHRETAWNLIGQCMEQENRPNDALKCYVKSLGVRTRNNAAKILICICLAKTFLQKPTTIHGRESEGV